MSVDISNCNVILCHMSTLTVSSNYPAVISTLSKIAPIYQIYYDIDNNNLMEIFIFSYFSNLPFYVHKAIHSNSCQEYLNAWGGCPVIDTGVTIAAIH